MEICKDRKGLAAPSSILLFSLSLFVVVFAFSIAVNSIKSIERRTFGIYSVDRIHRAILYCLANPGSSYETVIYLSDVEKIEFEDNMIILSSKNIIEKKYLEQYLSNPYDACLTHSVEKRSENKIVISYRRRLGEKEVPIKFSDIVIPSGTYKLIIYSSSHTNIKVTIILLG